MTPQERSALKALIPPYWAAEADDIIDTAIKASYTPHEIGAISVRYNIDTVIYNSWVRLTWTGTTPPTMVLAP